MQRPKDKSDTRLRDLTDAEFRQRYASDRFTASVLGNRFHYIIAHVSTKLRSNAFSPVIRDFNDFCVTVSGPPELGWPMPAAGLSNPVHWGPVGDAVRIVLDEIGVDSLRPGDIFVANDPYRTGKHLNDVSFIRPVFAQHQLVGAIHITAHQLDIGSRVVGGFDIAAETLWEDGLVLPPMLLYRAGTGERTTFNLIAANSRYPEVLLADLQVIRSSLDLGEQLLGESIARYGVAAYLGAIRYAGDVAAESMADALKSLPDGRYEGREAIDGDGLPDSPEYVVNVRIHKCGSRLEFDFSGTSLASRAALNCSWLDVKTGIILALRVLFDPKSMPNSAALRDVDVVLPSGSMVNPYPPTSTMYYFAMVQSVTQAIIRALQPAMTTRAIAFGSSSTSVHHGYGRTPEGVPWGDPSVSAGGNDSYAWGATAAGDADSAGLPYWMNYSISGSEIAEQSGLMVFMRREAATDTGGPGYNRGGAGQISDVLWMHGGLHREYLSQVKRPVEGVQGGRSSTPGGVWLFDAERASGRTVDWLPGTAAGAEYRRAVPVAGVIDQHSHVASYDGDYISVRTPVAASAGSTFRRLSSGGGGWGDPHQREPERVLQDVRDGYVSIIGAARDYGVVVCGDPEKDPEGLTLDIADTDALRTKDLTP